jgi:hypothetical protein
MAAQNLATLPPETSPPATAAVMDQTQLGACAAYSLTPTPHAITKSAVCNVGDPNGSKTLVAFGNSHTVMWTKSLIAVALTNHWKFYPIVKQACGYDTYAGLIAGTINQCSIFYKWPLGVIKRLHPDAIIIGSYTKTPYWLSGERTIITALRPLTPRLILLSDTPWIDPPGACLESAVTQASYL